MNYNVEFKFVKSNLWTKSKIEFYLKVKKIINKKVKYLQISLLPITKNSTNI